MTGAGSLRAGRAAGTLLPAAVALLCLWALPGRAEGAPPAGFQETTAFSGLEFPTAVAFSPDGRYFVGEKSGLIKVFDNLSDTSPTTFADLRTEVHNFWDRGLLGMVLDPQFPTDPYVYVLYTRDAFPGMGASPGNPPLWGTVGGTGDGCPTPPGATGDGCVVTGRLARLTASGNTATATSPLITDWCQQYPSHSTGDLGFGADGALYVSGGDGASFNFVDYGQDGNPVNPCGDPPGGVGAALTPPSAEGGALRSQDVRTTGDPTSLDGAVLRVNPDTGAALSGNPFFGSGDANRDRIIAYGQRNPFRLAMRPGTNEAWTGETGWNNWEELNRVPDPGGPAENFGWPCYEGNSSGSLRQSGYDNANLSVCENLYGPGEPNVVRPYFSYSHSAKVVSGESCPSGSSSVGGIDFYETGGFPNSYNGALFFADYNRDCIWAIPKGSNGLPDVTQVQTFNPGAANPTDLEVSPSGELFYTNYDGGQVRRIVYTAGNQPPNAVATATPSNGAAPLNVQLSASGSSDPDDSFATLSFAWDADNDGSFDDGTGATLNWTYAAGSHTARVRVSDPDGASDVDSVAIQSNNTPPVAQIDEPTGPTTWAVDDVVGFSGSATDAQQTLPATAFDWQVIIDHCPSNCHQHVAEQIADTANGSFPAPDHEYPSTLTIRLTVTDAGGLSDSESVTINPRTVNLTLNSVPGGLELGLNAETGTAPFTRTVIDGSQNTVSASGPQTLGGQTWNFGSWSDGGAATHNVTVETTQTLTATYSDATAPPAPEITATVPPSPANDNQPEVRGTAGGDAATVEVFTNSSCSSSPANGGPVALFAGAGIPVTVNSDTTTQLSARSKDAAGNTSTCSTAISYTEDSTGPPAPTLTDTDPDSPANDNNPEVRGSAGGAVSVRVFTSSNCTGTQVTGTPAQLTGAGITVNVTGDATTQLSANSSDAAGNPSSCSSAIPYTEDSTAPGAPSLSGTSPASPANDNTPGLQGSAGGGAVEVEVFANGSCSGTPDNAGTPAELAGSGITVAVAADTTSQLSARSSDAAGNASSCSPALSYTEDSTGPPAPTLTDTDPDSPANDNNPEAKGTTTGDAATVKLYTNGSCAGAHASTGSPASFSAGGITVPVPSDATTQLSAQAADAAGNDSGCSSSISYSEDSSPPPAPSLNGTVPPSPANDNDPAVRGTAGGDAGVVNLYASGDCSGDLAASGMPAELAGGGIAVTVPNDATTVISARSLDGANISPCSDAISYREDSTEPNTAFKGSPPPKVKFQPRRQVRATVRPGGGTAKFAFVADEPVPGFRCKLDSQEWTSCSSPISLNKLRRGRHVFSVRAMDLAGNADPSPATHVFRVVRKRVKKAPPA